MSTKKTKGPSAKQRREDALASIQAAGRRFSDTAVFFHTSVAECLGLTPAEWKLLGLLQEKGALTAGDFASQASLAPATISGMLKSLETKGWITRTRDREDNRRIVVSMAPNQKMKDLTDTFDQFLSDLRSLYGKYSTPDLEKLSKLLEEISDIQYHSASRFSQEKIPNL